MRLHFFNERLVGGEINMSIFGFAENINLKGAYISEESSHMVRRI